MELNTLRAFVQVARDGSFSQAAEHLYLTQPAISKRIATLESELDTRLFDRMGRQVFLTETGRHLLPRAEHIIDQLSDIRRELANLTGRVAGRLAMATSHHIGLHRLPAVLRSYSDTNPQVELDIHFMESEKACQAVEQGELELAVITLPLHPVDALQSKTIWHDPLAVIVGLDHPLAKQSTVGLRELIDYPAVLPSRGTYTRTLIEQRIGQHHMQVNCTLSTDYLETLKMMTTIGLGWSLLPEILVDDNLVPLQVPELKLNRSLGIVTHRKRTLSNAARAMRELLLFYGNK
ncbi:MAG: LysR family transcriptional regulator [gamma proteobacterium symbiont of Ctena orbiculata]|uniref:LysR family transcriptional regulator n=1 Tax=Candidatus Thiodiazotropha sp. CDECU1 TaxID=3065865 RepID=UPI000D583B25|nr:LysR family transcriptional regulator [Candidatus Thiodiazotropha sp. CDECU1]PVV06448.1 MAG: LysR family transcriptional regulator [gamma proteobacterium symbiont of Ctena orbiculata]PVV19895.1 MAG: LysR family transcriptional regulator [gamma proteobacterium symbiont of Ctena orbiculata]PVV26928.1 MAG: LysR family transcriptional regulator [gamma proteobacterium symbiont of Ctena orbiculata]